MMLAKNRALDLAALRSVLGDNRAILVRAIVNQVEVSPTLEDCKLLCTVQPDNYQVVATLALAASGPSAGIHQIPVAGDLVLVGFVDEDSAYVVGRLSSPDDPLPAQASSGHTIIKALAGKESILSSDTAVRVGRGSALAAASEPLVLGNVMATALGSLIEKLSDLIDALAQGPIGMGNLGSPVPTYPSLATSLSALKTQVDALKTQYVDTAASNIVSQIAFTER